MEIHCRHFNGYKPCGRGTVCAQGRCSSYSSVNTRVLIVHLEALGAVLRSTSLLAGVRRRYPGAHITWVTKAPAHQLLRGLGDIDRVLTTSAEDLLALSCLRFDVALVIDKSLPAAGVLARAKHVDSTFGFRADPEGGAILPANPEAAELWKLGLDDHQKFFVNQKSEQRLVHEALALGPYARDEYQCELTRDEREMAAARRAQWSPRGAPVIGINTGCSPTLPNKKLSIQGHRTLIGELMFDARFSGLPIVLLGGPEDTARNAEIARGLPVILSPTTNGLRDGLTSTEACDLIFSGDSLGMHMAIALKKWTVAWFGPTCASEIDLYDRGAKILTRAGCSPCWKRVCAEKLMCYDQVDFHAALNELARGLWWLTSSSKPRSPETFSSPSP